MDQRSATASPAGWARLLPIPVFLVLFLAFFPGLSQTPAWASTAQIEQLKQIPGMAPVVEAAQAAVTVAQEVAQPIPTAPTSGSACAQLLQHPRLELRGGPSYPDGPRQDLERGVVNPRLCQLLVNLLDQQPDLNIWVKVFKTGHFACVNGSQVADPNDPNSPGCRISDHFGGNGVDIFGVTGPVDVFGPTGPVSANNRAAHRVVEWLVQQGGHTRPHQIIHPFVDIPPQGKHLFPDLEHHDDHIHIGGFD
ncbi:hypothetical protein KY386_03325 [Candidatus Parcubacteria bacterium]|nr:hypothetical protein [Candidatus Parcubacteria bacterium]